MAILTLMDLIGQFINVSAVQCRLMWDESLRCSHCSFTTSYISMFRSIQDPDLTQQFFVIPTLTFCTRGIRIPGTHGKRMVRGQLECAAVQCERAVCCIAAFEHALCWAAQCKQAVCCAAQCEQMTLQIVYSHTQAALCDRAACCAAACEHAAGCAAACEPTAWQAATCELMGAQRTLSPWAPGGSLPTSGNRTCVEREFCYWCAVVKEENQ